MSVYNKLYLDLGHEFSDVSDIVIILIIYSSSYSSKIYWMVIRVSKTVGL